MSGRYARLFTSLAPDRELDAAFQFDDDEDDDQANSHETTPFVHQQSHARPADSFSQAHSPLELAQATLPGAYDFEADPFEYARPPPGSPPVPTALAIPNQHGNSNGLLPSAPAIPRGARSTGFFRRAVGALLPSHYQRVSTEERAGPARGGGTSNDGVFANMTAKPGRGVVVQDGESIHVVPEEVQKEVPPSYAVAQADAAPAYYETIVHAPSSGLDGEVLVDAMPTGSIFTFAWTMLISLSFQFVGFLLTYLLHTTHAAKYGSRAGLGITIIQYAFFLRRRAALTSSSGSSDSDESSGLWDVPEFNGTLPNASPSHAGIYHGHFSAATTEWISFFLMSVGWFVLLTSLLGFWRVKQWERGIRQANEPPVMPTPEDFERERNVRSSLMAVFGIPMDEEEGPQEMASATSPRPPPQPPASQPLTEAELRLTRDLQASGLL